MWPAFDLVNRGVFMELGSLRLVKGVSRTEGVQNGVSSKVYERKREAKKGQKRRGERKGKKRRGRRRKKMRKKNEGFVLSLISNGDFLQF